MVCYVFNNMLYHQKQAASYQIINYRIFNLAHCGFLAKREGYFVCLDARPDRVATVTDTKNRRDNNNTYTINRHFEYVYVSTEIDLPHLCFVLSGFIKLIKYMIISLRN